LFSILSAAQAELRKDSTAQTEQKKDSTAAPKVKENPTVIAPETYENQSAGEFTPGAGFLLTESKLGSLNISFYGLIRYVNQMPPDNSYQDHLGRTRISDTRQDINWHRTFVWLSGWFFDQRFRYTVSIWGLASTQQTLLFGNLTYNFNKNFQLGAGIGPNVGIRSLQGPWPYFLSSDRQMGEEALRPGFSGGVWLRGEVVPKLQYWFMLANNLSQLGVNVSRLTRYFATSGSLTWMPTTGEYGPRQAISDFELHKEVATRFGISACHMRDNRFNQTDQASPDNTQVRMSDGVLFYETGALADGITVTEADYAIVSVDAGFKYDGISGQAEFSTRLLSNIWADGPVPISQIKDQSLFLAGTYQLIERKLEVYATGSRIFDDFGINPWEVGGGLNYYPSGTRSLRINLHALRVVHSMAGGYFGFYTPGLDGTIISVGTDLLL
jgi:hypothetical protein